MNMVNTDISIDLYQQLASRTINKDLTIAERQEHALFGLASEVGEVLGLFQKKLQGHPLDMEHVKKELGDLFWMAASIATNFDFNLSEVLDMNIKKLKERFPNGFEVDKSINRKEGDI